MERLFSPCTRLRALFASRFRIEELRGLHPELQELNLDISTEELLSSERAFMYADLYTMLGKRNTCVWLTPHTAAFGGGSVVSFWDQLDGSCRLCFTADGKDVGVLARSPEHLLEICNVIVRLLAVNAVHSVHICKLYYGMVDANTLANLMEQCQSLKVLTLDYLEMDEDQIRVLGGDSRPDLGIVLINCKLTSAGTTALAEILGRDQGPTELAFCKIDNFIFAKGLRGNSRLKIFRPRILGNNENRNRQLLAIMGALKENEGLVDLDIWRDEVKLKDETWGAICDSLKAHPTLEVLDLSCGVFADSTISPAALNSRVEALVDMMKVNMSIHSIHLHGHYSQHELFQGSVIPYLDANRFRPRVRAIQRIRPIAYRAKVLGQALIAARTDANRFWMILSGNAEVAFPSRTTPAADVPTPASAAAASAAAAAASSTANDADVAASAISALTTNAAGSLPTATAAAITATSVVPNIATPYSASQKRKARP
jgi:hypothetical protein